VPTTPNLAGFQWFLVNVAAIDTINLPPTAPVVAFAFNVALGIVNPLLCGVCIPNQQNSPYTRSQFDIAVYNLATDLVINWAVDPTGSNVFSTRPDGTEMTFFEYLRFKWGIGNAHFGVVGSVSDVSTTTSIEVIEAAKTFTLGNLQNLKTPYGRTYLAIAQSYGALWGLT
jgi:hypothetical protein